VYTHKNMCYDKIPPGVLPPKNVLDVLDLFELILDQNLHLFTRMSFVFNSL